ncbi:MAG: ABC transporter permease [Thermoleophilia bacterium]
MSISAIWRLARRDLLRRPWRSALVVALIAVPVALFTFAAIGMRSVPDTADEAATRSMGQADLIFQRPVSAAPLRLPTGWRAVHWRWGSTVTHVLGRDGVRVRVEAKRLDLRDPINGGLYTELSGRLPGAADEVVVAPQILASLGAHVGDSIVLPPATTPFRIVGTAAGRDSRVDVVGPAVRLWPAGPGALDTIVVDTHLAPTAPAPDLPTNGSVVRRDSFTSGSFGASVLVVDLVGGLALAAFGLVVASALSVGARRQLRAIGLMGAVGATPRQRAAVMLVHGAVLGAAGVAVGLPTGFALWDWARTSWERFSPLRVGPTEVRTGDVAVIVVLALGTAIGAALVPARVASGTTVLHALAGRRPTPRVPGGVPVVGLLVSGAGLLLLATALSRASRFGDAASAMVLASAALTVGGMVIVTPYAVGHLEGLATHARGTARLAARAVARHRARTGPVVAAVMAAGSLIVATSTVVRSSSTTAAPGGSLVARHLAGLYIAAERLDGGPDQHPALPVDCTRAVDLAAPVARLLPGARTVCVDPPRRGQPGCGGCLEPADPVRRPQHRVAESGSHPGNGPPNPGGGSPLATVAAPTCRASSPT